MARQERWTVESMPSMAGRTVIVTGANSGVGFEGTKAFASRGATVVMACRSVDRGERARAEIVSEVPDASLKVVECDLGDLASVRSFEAAFESDHDDLHVLCNNAGVMAVPRGETADGFERQFGVNHLGHFAITGLLLDRLRGTAGRTRVVTQSSRMHWLGDVHFVDLQGERSYWKWRAYCQSKLANLLFAYELDRRLRTAGTRVESVACHPGYAATELQRRGPAMTGSTLRLLAMRLANALFAQSAARGALPMLYAATADDVAGGDFVGPGGFMGIRGHPEKRRSSPRSHDRERARRLWSVSEELTGVEYGLPEPTAGATE